MAKGMPTEGMGFSFVSRRFGENISDLVQAAMSTDPDAKAMAGFMGGMESQASYGVSVKMPDAIVTVSRSDFDLGEALVVQLAAVPGVMLMSALPAITQARGRAHTISDIGNLKQIGLGMMMYSMDNDDKFADDLGEIWSYINDGKVFVSPAGKTPPPANAAEVRAGKCDYLYFGKGKKAAGIQKPSETPLACTKPGLLKEGVNVLYCDGHAEWSRVVGGELRKLIDAAGRPIP